MRAWCGAASLLVLASTFVGTTGAGTSATNLPDLVLKPRVLPPDRAAALILTLFPDVRVHADAHSGSVVVVGTQARLDAVRTTFAALDQAGPTAPSAQAFVLRTADPHQLVATLRKLFPTTHVVVGPNRSIIAAGDGAVLAQIQTIVQSVDQPAPPPSPAPRHDESVQLGAANPADVARIVAGVVPGVQAHVAGDSVVLDGDPAAVERAKQLAGELDVPAAGVRYSQVYRLRYVDATSVGALIRRTFPDADVDVDATLNAITVIATTPMHERIADAVQQLDVVAATPAAPASEPGGQSPTIFTPSGKAVEVVSLRAAAPGQTNAGNSTSAADIAAAVNAALQPIDPDIRITVPPNNPTQLILAGTPESIRVAKQLIAQLDVAQKLVVLDTEIYEVDDNASKNLGLSLGDNPVISTTYTEQTPAPNVLGVSPPLQGLQALGRTPLSFGAQLNLLLQTGDAKLLADPRITTISGRTATIRAGENISILTTTGGASGTVATTQIQTFQTGISLDITPVINSGNFITVTLHPVVNSLAATNSAGIPQISTRDTQTTVAIPADQTLIIGGLIEDTSTRSDTKIPVLGDLPLIGKLFRNSTLDYQRNELVMTVTPHVLEPGQLVPNAPRATITPPPIPTLPSVPPMPGLPAARPGHRVGLLHRAPGAPAATPAPAQTIVLALGATPTPSPRPANVAAGPTVPPTPQAAPTPKPFALATPSIGAPSPTAVPTASATPSATPTAFAQQNVFTYGAAPQNNYAAPSDPVQIYFATFNPTVLKNGTNVSVSVITSSNVAKVTIGYQGFTNQLSSTGTAGQWQATYAFSSLGVPFGQSQVPLTLTASRLDGTNATITIPVSISQ